MDQEAGGFIAGMITEVLFSDEEEHPFEAVAARYFSPSYQQVTDGTELDYHGFLAHARYLRTLREQGATATVEVVDAVRCGRDLADRHIVTITKPDGSVAEIEVYAFATLDEDGRLLRVNEATRVLTGIARDAELAQARLPAGDG
jgi:PAS domain-containing protein